MLVKRGARTAFGARLALSPTALADRRIRLRLLSGRGGAAVLGRLLLSTPLEGLIVHYTAGCTLHSIMHCTVHCIVHSSSRVCHSKAHAIAWDRGSHVAHHIGAHHGARWVA